MNISQAEVSFWLKELEASKKFRDDQFTKRIDYKKLVEYFEGKQFDGETTEELISILNEFYPSFGSIIQNTYYQNPTVVVKAKHPDAEQDFQPSLDYILRSMQRGEPMPPTMPLWEVMQAALRHAVNKMGMKPEMQMALFDLLFAGFAIVEVNHRAKATEFQGQDQPLDPRNTAEKFADGVSNFIFGKENEGPTETEERVAREAGDDEQFYQIDETFIKRWDPNDILFDYRADTFRESRYIAKVIKLSVAEFKAEFPDFAGTIPSDKLVTIEYAGHKNSDNAKALEVFEVQIKKKDGVYILKCAEGIPEALDHYKDEITTNGFKLKYACIDKYGKIYPISRAKLAKKPQDELNHYTTIQMEHADRAMKKVTVYEEGLTDQGKKQLENNDPYGIVYKKSPQAVYEAMPESTTSPDNEVLKQEFKESLNKQVGSNELAQSGNSDSKFATQDALKSKAFDVNTSAVEDALGDLSREVIDTLKDIIMQVWDGEEFFKITGVSGVEMWYTPDMGPLSDLMIGDYLAETDIASAKRPDFMQDRQDSVEFATFILNPEIDMRLQMQTGKMVNVEAVLDDVAKSFRKNLSTYTKEIDPMAPVPLATGPQGAPLAPGPTPNTPQGTGGPSLNPTEFENASNA